MNGVCLHADVYVCAFLHVGILCVGVVGSGCVPASKPSDKRPCGLLFPKRTEESG